MDAWGHTKEQVAHCRQISGSHTGIWTAIFLFSYWVVPVGQVPSGGIAETGIASPRSSIIRAVTSFTNAGASSGTVGLISMLDVASEGTGTSSIPSMALSTAA